MRSYRIGILECPYDNWSVPETRDLFSKMVALKLEGYRREYKYGVLPLDTSDFIAIHQFIFLESPDGRLEPVIAFRSLGLRKTSEFPLPFPPAALLGSIGTPAHQSSLAALMKEHSAPGKDLVYGSSMAIKDEHRGDPAIKEILMSMDVHFQRDYGFTGALTGAVVRFKVDRLFHAIGYKALDHEGTRLDTVAVPFVHSEPTLFMRLDKFSPLALSCAEKHERLWRERLTIGASTAVAAAAPERKAA